VRDWVQSEWERLGGLALVLLPATLLFGFATWLRRAFYALRLLPRWRAPVPVVVVGNISVGGTGKTPLTLAILDLLQRKGFTPGAIARGYGRVPPRENDPHGVVRVYPDLATPELFGDEPVVIARRSRVPVYISPDRPAAARALVSAHPEVDVIVSDDGLQHYALARDVELAVVDGERRFGNGLLLPSGPLREPVSRLKRVDAVVVNGGSSDQRWSEQQFAMRLSATRFARLTSNQEVAPAEFALLARGRQVVAIAGIGHPPRFFEQLSALGVVARAQAFPDHHHYQASELRFPGAEIIVMTEKDAVKCAAFADARMWYLSIEAQLPREFDEFLLSRIFQARARIDGSQAA
jgi:tetraacyldisaccharide 4'-kinase